MSQRNNYKLDKFDYLKLMSILALAFYLAFIPHQNYPYLVHLDEWSHLAWSNEIIKEGTAIGLTDPFSGAPMRYQPPEIGFYIFWAGFHQISGIPWLDTFKYFPAIVFIITILSVYVLAQRQRFGWEAALCTCLIPTTVGILGPGFLVPVAMGLLFIALSLFVAFNFTSWRSYIVLFIFSLFLLSMHVATLVGLIIILTPHIMLNLKGNFKHSLGVTLAVATPFLIALVVFRWIWDWLVLREITSLLVPKSIPYFIDIPQVTTTYGYLPILLCLVGIFLLAIRGGKRNYSLILGLLALALMLVIYFTFGYGIGIMYYRGLQYMMLMVGIVAGVGLMGIKSLKLPAGLMTRLKAPPIIRNVGYILCLILIGLTLYIAIPTRQNTFYYHMVDERDYEAFVWIRDNVDRTYEKAALDPWKGAAFTAITGKYVYTWIGEYPVASDQKTYEFLRGGCEDTAFLKNNGISIVYTRQSCNNPDLVEVKRNIYLLKETQAP